MKQNKGFLGIDTSNYTTSLEYVKDGRVEKNLKKMLAVEEGKRGLRQGDAVFSHTVNIPELARMMGAVKVDAIGVSTRPRDVEGSYMPCFLCGVAEAEAIASILGVPVYGFSHQEGHIMAALYSCDREDLFEKEFLSFHVSGGTTELLHVKEGKVTKLGGTLDISAGKAIDRIGVKLGMKFPCGKELEKAAGDFECAKEIRVCVNGFDCNLSGLENKADQMISGGAKDCEVASYVLEFIYKTIKKMTENALTEFKPLPVVYAGGVMSNRRIKEKLLKDFDAFFAEPEFSCDNAAGIALLCKRKWESEND